MANTLRFKRGLVSGIPNGALGEPLFTTDTFDLYIGNGTGNTRFQKYIASGTTSQLLRGDGSLLTMPIVLTSPSNGQVLKFNGTNWVNDSDAGITGSGTTNYLPKFASSTTLNNSSAYDSGAGITVERAGDVTLGVTATAPGSTSIYLTPNGGGFGQLSTLGSTHLRLGTNGTERARFTAGGNFLLGGTSDNGQRFQVTGTSYFSDNIGIGVSNSAARLINIGKNISGSTIAFGIAQVNNVASDVTNSARIFYSEVGTVASAFTLSELNHYYAVQGTFGAGSAVTSQYGFRVFNNLTGATNNYGFYGDIASGTGRWNLYMNGSASNYVNGELLVGTTTSAGTKLNVSGTAQITGNVFLGVSATSNSILYLFNATNTGRGEIYYDGTNNAFRIESTYGGSGTYRPMTFWTSATERMRLDASGNLGLGVTPSSRFHVDAAAGSAQIRVSEAGTTRGFVGGANGIATGRNGYFMVRGEAGLVLSGNGNSADMIINPTTANVQIGVTGADAGFRLDVNGTMRVSGASTFNANMALIFAQNAATTINIINTTSATGSEVALLLTSSNGQGIVGKYSATKTTYKTLVANDAYFYNGTSGDISILNDFASGGIKMAAGGSSTAHLTIASTGAATFSSSVTGASFVPTSSTIPTNGMYLSAANTLAFATASGNRLTIASTGVATFSSTINVGGTATFTNSSSVNIVGTATLVGATARNTSTATGDTQAGFFVENGTSNGQLYKAGTNYTTRKTIAANDLGFYNAAAGNISILNDFASGSIILTAGGSSTAQWTIGANGDLTAADGENIIVGTTNGTKIGTSGSQKLGFWNATPIVQPNNSVAAANFVAGIGTSVTTLDAFDGYTIGQVVRALRNAGILS